MEGGFGRVRMEERERRGRLQPQEEVNEQKSMC